MKKTTKNTPSRISSKLILVVLILVAAFWYFSSNKMNLISLNKTNEKVAQLSSNAKVNGMGTATKNFEDSKYMLGVTALINKPTTGKTYFVWLRKGDSKLAEKMLVGKLVASGDAYTLSYTSDTNYSAYKEVVVTEQLESETKDGKLENEVLTGEFVK